jgi:hypothetical protein
MCSDVYEEMLTRARELYTFSYQMASALELSELYMLEVFERTGFDPDEMEVLIGGTEPRDGLIGFHHAESYKAERERCKPNGAYILKTNQMCIVFMYDIWENEYRPRMGIESNGEEIESDLFSDIRHLRNAILHRKGMLDKNLRVLAGFSRGDYIEITSENMHNIFQSVFSEVQRLSREYGKRHLSRVAWQEVPLGKKVMDLNGRKVADTI